MSTLKVNKIRDTSGSTDAITLDPSGGAVLAGVTTMTTARITTGITTSIQVGGGVTISESGIEASGIGITCANINGTQISGRRNLVINGAMSVAQRGTSSTSQGYHTVDRFKPYAGGADENPTQAQVDVSSGTSPYTEGFRKALKITNGNQTSGAGGADYMQIEHKFEAHDLANSGWNYTSSSSFITLSFWVKSSVSQDFQIVLRTTDGTSQSFQFETPTLSANTWTKIVKTIPGNSNITFDNNASQGMAIYWFPFIGTNYTSPSNTLNAWVQSTSGTYGVTDPTTWWTTNDATFELTGVQLEVGSQATAFEHRTFGDELALCQRYFQKYACTDQEWIYVESNGAEYKWWQSHFNPMRTTPTVDISGLSTGSGTSFAGGSGNISSIAVTSTSGGDANGRVSYRVTGSATWGTARTLHHTDSWDGEFVTYSAEL